MSPAARRFIAAGVEAQNTLARLATAAAELGLEHVVTDVAWMGKRIENLLDAVEDSEKEMI
jgi:hypothetical protein